MLRRSQTVKLLALGSFVVRKKGQRIGRNPKTGKEIVIWPRRVVVFKPSKRRINSVMYGMVYSATTDALGVAPMPSTPTSSR